MNQIESPENPYATPTAVLADAASDGPQLAGRGTRLAATLLDGAILGVGIMLGFLPSMLFQGSADAAGWSMSLVLVIGVGLLVVNAVLVAQGGQTIAKYLLKIRVTRRDGSNPGLARIFFARYLPVGVLGALPFIGILVSLTDALLIFRDNCRCLHDEIADTIVVKA